MEGPLEQLIKERKPIFRTLTKTADKEHTAYELASLLHVDSLDIVAPRVIASTDKTISMEFFPGISAFRALELLSFTNCHNEIEKLLVKIYENFSFSTI